MTNIAEQLRTISNQVRVDEIARDKANRLLMQSKTEARISQKVEQIKKLALKAAERGDTSLTVSRLDFNTYGYTYEYERHKTITPDALRGDDRLVAEVLVKEGFEIFIGYVEPSGSGCGVSSESIYNYFGITWRENRERSIYEPRNR